METSSFTGTALIWNFKIKNGLKDVQETIKSQKRGTQNQFEELYQQVFTQMAKEELNVKLFYQFNNDDDRDWVPVVPTSAHSGL